MNIFVWYGFGGVLLALTLVAGFFFVFTRGTLLVRELLGRHTSSSHVYPMYSDMWLIRLVDHQPLIAAILLFQYRRMVSRIGQVLASSLEKNQTVMFTSCAFGNVVPRLVEASATAQAGRILVTDLIDNELTHVRSKLGPFADRVEYLQNDATNSNLPDSSVSANILFFLLHELPHPLKARALDEAARVLQTGGSLYIAEFHRPRLWALRVLSYLYFKVFEPYGLALWDQEDPQRYLNQKGRWSFSRSTYLFSNYQVLVATKL